MLILVKRPGLLNIHYNFTLAGLTRISHQAASNINKALAPGVKCGLALA
jgi:hypothetical protein